MSTQSVASYKFAPVAHGLRVRGDGRKVKGSDPLQRKMAKQVFPKVPDTTPTNQKVVALLLPLPRYHAV